MKRPYVLLGAGLLALSAFAAGVAAPPTSAVKPFRTPHAPDTVRVTIGRRGFTPSNLRVRAGHAVVLLFTRTSRQGCGREVQIPAFGVAPTALPLNRPVAIKVTPREAGEFTFACGMNMMRGTLVVVSRT